MDTWQGEILQNQIQDNGHETNGLSVNTDTSPARQVNHEELFIDSLTGLIVFLLFFNGGMKTATMLAALSFTILIISRMTTGPIKSYASRTAFLLAGWTGLTAVFAVTPRASLHSVATVTTAALIFHAITNLSQPGSRLRLLRRLTQGIHLFLGLALIHYFLADTNYFHYTGFVRKLVFTLGHYNHFGALLLFILPLPWILCSHNVHRLIWTTGLFIAILCTSSRGATGAAVIQILLLIFFHSPQKKRLHHLLGVLVLITLLAVSAMHRIPGLQDKLTRSFFQLEAVDNRGRDVIWKAALDMTVDHPWAGIGPGNYPVMAPVYARGQLLDAHNLFLGLLAETGVPGFLLFITLLIAVARTLQYCNPPLEQITTGIALTGVLIQSLVTGALTRCGSLYILLFIFLSLFSTIKPATPTTTPHSFAPQGLRFMMNTLLAFIVLLFLSLPLEKNLTFYLSPILATIAAGLALFLANWNMQRKRFILMCLCFSGLTLLVATALTISDASAFHGLLAARRGDVQTARMQYRKALQLDPTNGPLHMNLAALEWKSRNRQAAVNQWQLARKYLPHDPIIISNLSLALPAAERPALLRKLSEVEQSGYSELRQAITARDQGKVAEAEQLAIQALRMEPALAFSPFMLLAIDDSSRNGLEFCQRIFQQVPLLPPRESITKARIYGALYQLIQLPKPRIQDKNEPLELDMNSTLTEQLQMLTARAESANDANSTAYYHGLKIIVGNGTLPPTANPFRANAMNALQMAWLNLLADRKETAILNLYQSRRAENLRVPPTHFVHATPLVPDSRLIDPLVIPAVPTYLDDNFRFEPAAACVLPLRAAAQTSTRNAREKAATYAVCWLASLDPPPPPKRPVTTGNEESQ